MRDPVNGQTITLEALLARSIAHIDSCLAYQTTKRFWNVLTPEEQARALLNKMADLINEAPAAIRQDLTAYFARPAV